MWGILSRPALVVAAGLLAAGPAVAQIHGPSAPAPRNINSPARRPATRPPVRRRATPNGPDLSVRNVVLSSISGNTARVNLFLAQPGAGQQEDKVAIYWVEGSRRTKLWEGRSRFAGTRAGFMHTETVTLPRNHGDGRIEVVAGEQGRDPNWANNVKSIRVGGGDLVFDGQPQIEQRAGGHPNRTLRLKVKNEGPGAVPAGCKVQLHLAERGPARTFNLSLPALRPNQSHTVEQRYDFVNSANRSHNRVEATIVCHQDPVTNNNALSLPLR